MNNKKNIAKNYGKAFGAAAMAGALSYGLNGFENITNSLAVSGYALTGIYFYTNIFNRASNASKPKAQSIPESPSSEGP